MNDWSNIQSYSQDAEIIKINNLEKKLGELPDKVLRIRELITRFEVCHFKYQLHVRKIKDSINVLEPGVYTITIGINHIQHGEDYKDLEFQIFESFVLLFSVIYNLIRNSY